MTFIGFRTVSHFCLSTKIFRINASLPEVYTKIALLLLSNIACTTCYIVDILHCKYYLQHNILIYCIACKLATICCIACTTCCIICIWIYRSHFKWYYSESYSQKNVALLDFDTQKWLKLIVVIICYIILNSSVEL